MSLDEVTATGLLAGFPEPMLVIQPSGSLVFVNQAAERLLELELEAGQTDGSITDFLPEDERSRLQPLTWLQRWAETPDAPEMEYVHLNCRTRSGRVLPVRVRVGRIREAGETFYVVMLQDISIDQSRQQQTRAAHRLAARVLAISADAIITVDPELKISYANPSAEKLFGYGSGELIGLALNALLPERFRTGHADHIAGFAAESRPARLMGERAEVVGLSRSGEEIPLEASITKVTLDREIVFSAHLRDLRARKQAEAQLARTRASLQTVFDHAMQAMALINPDGTVAEMNAAGRRLLPPEVDPLGTDFAALPFWSADPEATASRLREALAGCLAGETYRVATTLTLPDSISRQLDFSLTPVMVEDGVFAVIAEARDLIDSDRSASA